MQVGKVHIEGNDSFNKTVEFIRQSLKKPYERNINNLILFWSESFSWWYTNSVMFCIAIEKITDDDCKIEIISGDDRKGLLKISTNQGYLASAELYDKLRKC